MSGDDKKSLPPRVVALVIISSGLIVSFMISSNYDSKAVYSSSKHGSHLSNFTDLESVSKISKKLINKTGISSLDKDDSEKTKGSGDGKTLPQILSLKGTNLVEAQIPLIAEYKTERLF